MNCINRSICSWPQLLLPLALLASTQFALAQQPPSAGGQMLQIPPSPVAPRAAPEIRIERRTAPVTPGADQVKIRVRTLQVTGARLYSEAELIGLTGFTPGSDLSLSDLRGMASRITEHYRANGYFVAQAYIPAQDIRNDAVTIAVSEGQYGNVTVRNQSGLADRLPRNYLDGLNSGDVIVNPALENRLLLLSDLPGVNVRSTLTPGASVGTSDLIVDVTPGQRITGSIDADNAGNPYTGEVRVGATVNVNNPLGQGDVASLRLLTSGSGLKYGRGSYQIPFGRAQVGVAYSKLDYSLGQEFEKLQAHGTAEIASIYGRYPLIRTRDRNLYFQLAYDAKTFQDRVDSTSSVTDKQAQVLTASLYGDSRDTLGGGGLSSYGLTWWTGNIDIQTPEALAAHAASARSNGHFNKLSFNAMRLQSLRGPFSVYAAINGQVASKNLDVSEKMELGGMNAVRAYPEGEAYADEGYVLTLEGRMQLRDFSSAQIGHVQLIGFIDTGTVRINKNPWTPGQENRRTLSAAGIGVNWSDPGNFMVRAYYARKLGHETATSSPDKSGRFWIQLVKYF